MELVARIAGAIAALVSAGIAAAGVLVDDAQEPEPTGAPFHHPCPAPRTGWHAPAEPDAERPEIQAALRTAQDYVAAHPYHFRTVAVCPESGTLLAYRIPRGPDIDDVLATLVELASPADVRLEFVDVTLSALDVRDRVAEVGPYVFALMERGILVNDIDVELRDSVVTVAVVDNVRGARAVLADLGDRARVVRGR